jgi:hypothetical protein
LIKEEMKIQDITLLETEFMNHINNSQYIVESDDLTHNLNTIPKGRYMNVDSFEPIFLKEDSDKIADVLGYPVFRLTCNMSGKEHIITEQELESF